MCEYGKIKTLIVVGLLIVFWISVSYAVSRLWDTMEAEQESTMERTLNTSVNVTFVPVDGGFHNTGAPGIAYIGLPGRRFTVITMSNETDNTTISEGFNPCFNCENIKLVIIDE